MPDSEDISVRVQMYRHGLGDCFLLTFGRAGGDDFNLLIDCGIFFGTKHGKKIMVEVAEDIRQTAKGRLDAVALTHDHYDHTSGFDLAKDVFEEIEFEELWVGWTEDENHPKYELVRERYHNILKGLRAALHTELKKSDKLSDLHATVDALVNHFFGVGEGGEDTPVSAKGASALGATGYSKIWNHLLKEKDAKVRYCNPGTFWELADLGVRVYVLGPPEDYEIFTQEEPTAEAKKEESYRHSLRMALASGFLAAATGRDDSIFESESFLPFDKGHRIAEAEAKNHEAYGEFFTGHYGFGKKDPNAWQRIDEDWLAMAGELALWMDDFTNNTCLALAIELVGSGKVMLFPGDAQFGNWISWQDLSWQVPDVGGDKQKVGAADLLARTVLYKVGHHGSHNATLRKHGLEMMNSPELVAMIPTNREFAKSKGDSESGGWKMPEPKLFDRLIEKTKGRVILADEVGPSSDQKKPFKERCKTQKKLTPDEMKNFLSKVDFGGQLPDPLDGPLFVEYKVEG